MPRPVGAVTAYRVGRRSSSLQLLGREIVAKSFNARRSRADSTSVNTPTGIRARLLEETTLDACAEICCDHLVEAGLPLPSVYFERSGRLRCYASRGYWQVLDGFPPEFGVIAATVRTGESHFVRTAECEIYLQAAPSVVAEICVPVVHAGRPIGAINLESTVELSEAAFRLVTDLAAALSERIEELGGIAVPEGWRLLADQIALLAHLQNANDIAQCALETATRLSSTTSGALVNRTGQGGIDPIIAIGPMADALRSLPESSLSEIGQWVAGPRSCYTVGQPDGHGFTGQDSLRLGGVGTLLVVSLTVRGEQLGFMLVADERSVRPAPELVEQLEVLSSQVAAALEHAINVERLVELARRDPLTGLGQARAFSTRLEELANSGARHAVLSIDVDHFKRINDQQGHDAGDRALCAVGQAMNEALRLDDCLFRTGGDEFAVAVPVRDESDALRIADRIQRAARRVELPVSIGVAVVDADETDLRIAFARADAALYRVKRRGRDGTALAHPDQPIEVQVDQSAPLAVSDDVDGAGACVRG
ncbi:MAG: diguanylate cyclase/phosphodiesterase & domain with sensor(s) [Ilumatobacteraceae bacterium]|nr:diguanylate cyclase/phosphodiesterase & domain with sensor(s) [Ilumatobacteraceae bacterium]